jgi:hypothetical protein
MPTRTKRSSGGIELVLVLTSLTQIGERQCVLIISVFADYYGIVICLHHQQTRHLIRSK